MTWLAKRNRTEKMVLVALFSTLTWIGAYLRVDFFPPVPFTLQNFMVVMAGILLGPRYGALSQAVYLLLGLAGIPVFTQGGGLGYVLRPGFGFILGFVCAAAVVGGLSKLFPKLTVVNSFGLALSGMIVIYLVAVPYLYLLNHLVLKEPVAFGQIVLAMLPFLLGDLLKALLIAVLIPPLRLRLRDLGF